MIFDEWWKLYWKRTNQPEVFDVAMREIALTAWNAGLLVASNKVYEAEDGMTAKDYGHLVVQYRAV